MTTRTFQCKVFWALLSSSENSGVPEESKSPTLQVLGFTPTLGQSGVATFILSSNILNKQFFLLLPDEQCELHFQLLDVNCPTQKNRELAGQPPKTFMSWPAGRGGGGDYGLVSSDDQLSAAAAKRLSLVSRALRIATSALSYVRTRFGIAPLPASQPCFAIWLQQVSCRFWFSYCHFSRPSPSFCMHDGAERKLQECAVWLGSFSVVPFRCSCGWLFHRVRVPGRFFFVSGRGGPWARVCASFVIRVLPFLV
jgi:hypothetical protein